VRNSDANPHRVPKRYSYANTNRHGYVYPNCDSDGHIHSYANAYRPKSDAYIYSYANANSDSYVYTNCDCHVYPYANA
jgi:hypothetical protein